MTADAIDPLTMRRSTLAAGSSMPGGQFEGASKVQGDQSAPVGQREEAKT
jgi:hypothetical protein